MLINLKLKLKRKQTGMTLVEIMVAVLITGVLMAGMFQIYLSNKRSSRSQDAMAYMNNNARFAMQILQDSVALAGFRADPSHPYTKAFPALSATVGCPSFAAGEYIQNNTNDTSGDTDLFCVRTQSSFIGISNHAGSDMGEMFDCTGVSTDTDNVDRSFVSRFFINNNSLQCQTTNNTTTLIDDVTVANRATDLLYGIDTDNDKVANKYIPGASVTTTEWNNAVAVRLTLTASSNFTLHGDVTFDDATTELTKTYTRTLTLRSKTL